MAFFQRGKGSNSKPSRGGKSYGSKPFKKRGFGGDRGYGDRDHKQVFDAVCADCGVETTVPFKPTGSKPVLCRDCFRGSEDAGPKPRRSERTSYGDKPRRDSGRRSFDRGPQRSDATERRLDELNEKMDLVLDELAALQDIFARLEVVGDEEETDIVEESEDIKFE